MRDSTAGKAAAKGSPSPLRYIPATLVSGFCLAFLLFSPGVSDWSRPWFYGLFLKGKGAPPPTRSVAVVSVDPESGPLTRESAARLAKSILNLHPSVLAVNLPAALSSASESTSGSGALDAAQDEAQEQGKAGESMPTQGSVVLAHGFRAFKPWAFSEAAVKPYPSLLSRSLYPLLDGPGQGLDLPMGEGMEISDSLLKWPSPSTGFSWPLGRDKVYAVPAFARLGRGVVASMAVEAVRRALGIPAEKVGYLDGVGILLNAGHVLPMDGRGLMFLRFHGPGGIPRIPASRLLDGTADKESIKGKIVFLDAVDPGTPGIATVAGYRSATEIWADAAADAADNMAVTAPAWGGILSVTLGIVFSAVIILAMLLDFGGGAATLMAMLLAVLYPIVAFIVFLKSSWWLPPELPPLMVAAVFFPFAAARLLFPHSRASSPAIPPAPAYDPMLASVALSQNGGGARPAGSLPPGQPVTPARGIPLVAGQSVTPARGIPLTAPVQQAQQAQLQPQQFQQPQAPRPRPQAPKERQAAPEARFSDPRDPPLVASPGPAYDPGQAPAQRDAASLQTAPRHAHPNPQPAPAQTPAVAHTGTISDDIERDAKGGLVRVGKYRIVRKMGFGSAGDVFEGFDTHMGRKVAIKTITKNAAAHFDRASERFVLEAKAAGSLNHPCINTVYDFGTIREVSYMVLEYLDGITLSQWMRNHPSPPTPGNVAHWLQQISSALDYAHSHKVIHRDLKPSNLMVVNNGATIKLLDFGIAKMEDVGLTQTGMTVGTPSYMSPEQLSGIKVNPASDQYGLAVVIYQLLTYKLPYIGTKIPELCNRILKNDLVPITEANPVLGGAFWDALRKALAKTPEERYGSCTEMYQALEAAFPA